MPALDDLAAWRELLSGFDTVMLGLGMHWAGQPSCIIAQMHPETRPQIDAAFNATIQHVVKVVNEVSPPRMRLWWRSQPAGLRHCGRYSAVPTPLRSLEDTRRCDTLDATWAEDDDEVLKLHAIDRMAGEEAIAAPRLLPPHLTSRRPELRDPCACSRRY